MPSLKKNLFYSIVLVLANYVFPFLTYPYVSRVLGVTGIGACNFVDSIINYFILFSTLGIDTFGVRGIAKHKDNREALNRTFSNLFLVNIALTGIMLLLLVVATFTVPQLSEHKDLMAIGAFKLVFNCLLVEWLFKGLEEFRYVTLRTVLVKTLYVASVFLLVRQREDVGLYYLLSTLMVVINGLVNVVYAKTRIRIVWKGLKLLDTFKSLAALGVYAILTSMYTTFNVTFLGFVSGETEVGYYSSATKIFYLVMSLFAAFTNVMLPRMSHLVSAGEREQFKSYFSLAIELLLAFSLPILLWMMFMAPDIIQLISGPEFGGAVIPMIVIAPLLFVVGYEQILVLQTLLPLGKDKLMLRNSLVGALLGVGLNILLVPLWASLGSSVVWVAVECTILVLSQIAVTKELGIRFPWTTVLRNAGACLPLAALVFACRFVPSSAWVKVFLSITLVAIYMAVFQLGIRKGQLLKALK